MDHLNQPPRSNPVAVISHPSGTPAVQDQFYVSNSRYFDSPEDTDSDGGLLEYWRILRRNKVPIILSSLVGLLLGFLVGIPMKPVFRVTTSLEVLNLNEDFMNMKQASPTTTNSESYDISEEQTQAKLLESSDLLNRVYGKMDKGGVLTKKIPLATTGWRSWLHMSEYVPMTRKEVLLMKAADSLKIVPTKSTRVLEITVESKDPVIATDFANTLVQEFIQQSLEARRNASHGQSDWLNKEIDDARTRLHDSEDALQAYASKSGLIIVDQEEETNIATEKLQQVQVELSAATADRIAKQARYELAKNSPPDSLADVMNDDSLQASRSKVDDVRRQLADLNTIYSPDYSKVKRAEAELAALQTAYNQSRTDLVKSIQNDYQQASQREKLLSGTYDAQTREVSGQDQKEIQYKILKRDVDSNRLLYDMMLQQTKQASIATAMRASNVRVVDPAQVPEAPAYPNFKLNSALGLFAGLCLSIAFVVVRERADRTLQQPGEVKLLTNLPELGSIPSASLSMKAVYGIAAVGPNPVGGARRGLKSFDATDTVELITWKHKPSVTAEAFRSALTSIFFVGENGSRPRVLVFTSANPADGKTTVVSNLAIATAELRIKVLVIDADLRRPRMHNIFGVSNERGLADLLSEDFSKENLDSLVQKTSVPGLSVLPGGSPTQAAAHLLYSPNFAAVINECKKEYDMILIDTPPMLQMTDARVTGRLADAVILVARAGKTTRDSLLAVKDRFAEDRIRVLGTILNDWDPKRSTNGYYYSSYSARYGGYYAAGNARNG